MLVNSILNALDLRDPAYDELLSLGELLWYRIKIEDLKINWTYIDYRVKCHTNTVTVRGRIEKP